MLPRRRPQRPSPLPVLPLAAACLLLLAAVQLALWWWKYDATAILPALPNPFSNVAQLHPLGRQSEVETREPIHINTQVLPQNLQFGDAQARVVITIFNDPACGECRKQVKRWLTGVPVTGVKLVYKFWPRDPDRVTAGMLIQLANRNGVVGDFWQRLQTRDGDFDDVTLLSLLDASGLPLAKQRAYLAKDGALLTQGLEGDIATAKANHLPPPPVIVMDDLLMDGEILDPNQLATYVKRRLAGEAVTGTNDLWLMKR